MIDTPKVVFAVLTLSMAACTASYFWIFLYRPASFRFSLPQLEALVWYKRALGTVYLVVAMLGLGFTLGKGIELALWWVPKTWMIWNHGEEQPLVSALAVPLGMFGAGFVEDRISKIAQNISALKDEPSLP